MHADEFVLDPDLLHLNHAGVAPWPRRCAEAVHRFANINAHRSYAGSFDEWMAAEQRLRERITRLIGAVSPDDIALLKNTSEGLSLVAHGLNWRPGQRVVALAEEFVSNLVVWESLARQGVVSVQVVPGPGQSPEDAMEAACIEDTRLLSVSSVQYGTGYRMDLARLGAFCRERDILFCVDAVQSLGALTFDVGGFEADFVVSGAHKWLMSPFGIGLFWCRPALRDQLWPTSVGWHTLRDPMRFHGTLEEMESSARRFEAGTQNLASVMGFEATLSLFEEIGHETLEANVLANARWLAAELASRPGVELLSPFDGPHLSGNVCIGVNGADLPALAARMEQEHGVLVAARGPSLRFSAHGYQGPKDLARGLAALDRSRESLIL